MYSIAVQRDFVARHFLVGGDWGPENELHSHHYKVEVRLDGTELDRHGYLVDIVDVEEAIENIVELFSERTLNELPEFKGLNPSIEHFSRIICLKLPEGFGGPNVTAVTIKIWENEIAWTAYRRQIR
ncbi:6-pyruvoyl tetrahydropterin synthase family protein [Thermodesulfobacteriota bacterium]